MKNNNYQQKVWENDFGKKYTFLGIMKVVDQFIDFLAEQNISYTF